MPKHLTQLKTADIDISDKTFAMTYSRSFMQRTEQVKRLATHDIDDALEFAEHDQFHVFFPTLFRLPIRFNTFHATSNSISTFSMLKIFCGYQYSSSKPLEYPAKLQQANAMLRHSFMKPVILVGKVFGSNVLDVITHEILADAHYSTHEYVVNKARLTRDMQRSTTSHARSSTTSPHRLPAAGAPQHQSPQHDCCPFRTCRYVALGRTAVLLYHPVRRPATAICLFAITMQHAKASRRAHPTQQLGGDLLRQQLAPVRQGSCTAHRASCRTTRSSSVTRAKCSSCSLARPTVSASRTSLRTALRLQNFSSGDLDILRA